MYNLGFLVFTLASIGVSMVPGHLRDSALQWPRDGLDQPARADDDHRRAGVPGGVRAGGTARPRADVPDALVQNPAVHGRKHRLAAQLDRPRWLMFMLIIRLQGIWLPQHGYSFATPLWAGGLHAATKRRLPRRRPSLRLAF